MDLDHFKAINDTCGHEAGDALLKSLGPCLVGHLRQRDTLARLGGDEFGFLLEHCPPSEAQRIAERLRSEVEQLRFEWAGRTFSIGASIGIVEVAGGHSGITPLLRAADEACYAAKAGGGNRVYLGGGVADQASIPARSGVNQ
jgi:diguanylate cyclase (GGDEF)-like protein